MMGHSGTDGLTPLQKRIYALIKEKGKILREEIAPNFALPQWEIEKQMAILRHCELIRATKEEDGKIYITTM
jgi:hypothetical protein